MKSARLERFMESSGALPTTQSAYRKCLGTCNTLFFVSYTPQSVLEECIPYLLGRRLGSCRLVSSQTFIRSTIREFSISLLCGYWRLSTKFLSNRSHHVVMDGCRNKQTNVVSVVPQAAFWACY